MKIDNYTQILKNLNQGNNADPKPVAGKKFGDILNEAIGNSKQEVGGLQQTAFVNPLAGIQSATTFELNQQVAIDGVENLIELLDQYRQKLSDPRISLKKIDPIIRKIDQQKEKLAPVLDALPDDEKLKDIVNKTLVTASLEITKFYRGDYIAS
ncbi:MAG: hypothetical protein JSW26_23675 [Desulfobacterales bacterium]|nr:MAG: hypothetical protein JSW26_23675 [Desulfobacterales bacterium]